MTIQQLNSISKDFDVRITEIAMLRTGKELYDDSMTIIKLTDEAGGEFLEVSQVDMDSPKIRLELEEWPTFSAAMEFMFSQLKGQHDAHN